MTEYASFTVKGDHLDNRLYITLQVSFDEETAAAAVEEIQSEAEALPEGFEVITDLTEYDPKSGEINEYIREGKQIVASEGASRVVRVRGLSSAAKDDFNAQGAEEEYSVVEAGSIDRAEEVLSLLSGVDEADE